VCPLRFGLNGDTMHALLTPAGMEVVNPDQLPRMVRVVRSTRQQSFGDARRWVREGEMARQRRLKAVRPLVTPMNG